MEVGCLESILELAEATFDIPSIHPMIPVCQPRKWDVGCALGSFQ
jgi:hypothetical protein